LSGKIIPKKVGSQGHVPEVREAAERRFKANNHESKKVPSHFAENYLNLLHPVIDCSDNLLSIRWKLPDTSPLKGLEMLSDEIDV